MNRETLSTCPESNIENTTTQNELAHLEDGIVLAEDINNKIENIRASSTILIDILNNGFQGDNIANLNSIFGVINSLFSDWNTLTEYVAICNTDQNNLNLYEDICGDIGLILNETTILTNFQEYRSRLNQFINNTRDTGGISQTQEELIASLNSYIINKNNGGLIGKMLSNILPRSPQNNEDCNSFIIAVENHYNLLPEIQVLPE